jgi:hypothetical protein
MLGAATRMRRHRLLIGAIRRLVLLAQRIIRMFDMYFSIVRRSAAWASRDRESASLITTTMLGIRVKREAGGCVGIRTLETLFRTEIHLLCLSNFFE